MVFAGQIYCHFSIFASTFCFKFRKNQRIHLILVNWLSKNMFLSFELLKDIKVYIKITTILFHDNNVFKADSPFKSFIAKG